MQISVVPNILLVNDGEFEVLDTQSSALIHENCQAVKPQ